MDAKELTISVLTYAEDKIRFSYSDLLDDLDIELGSNIEQMLRVQISSKEMLFMHHLSYYSGSAFEEKHLRMTTEDRFRLLEYTELHEARQSSLQATKQATFAIIISIASLIVSMGLSLYEILNRGETVKVIHEHLFPMLIG